MIELYTKKEKEMLNYINSLTGRELEIDMVLQGYEENIFTLYMLLLGSAFTASQIVKYIKETYDLTKTNEVKNG